MAIDHAVMLDRRRKRQEQLACRLDGGREPHVDTEAPLEVLVRIVPALRLGTIRAGQTVAILETRHLEGIGLTGLERVENHVAMRVEHEADHGRIALEAEYLLLQLGAELFPAKAELESVVDVTYELAAGNVEIAGDGLEREDAVPGLHAVRLHVDGQAPRDLRGLGRGVDAGGLGDEAGIHTGDLGGLLGWHLLDTLGELLEAVAPALDEVGVVEVLLDDDVEHRHAQGGIRTGAQAQMPVGAGRHPVDARVDAHQLGAAAHHVDGGVTE